MIKINDSRLLSWLKDTYNSHGADIRELNVFGIRNKSGQKNDKINDVLGVFSKDTIYLAKGTTDPGAYWTDIGGYNGDKKGVAHLSLGYTSKMWHVRKHRGEYYALCNDWRCDKQKIWRDIDRDYQYTNKDFVVSGYFAINLHRMDKWHESARVGKWSAGCQVFANPKDFNEFMKLILTSHMYKSVKAITYFGYYLFDISEVPEDLYKAVYS